MKKVLLIIASLFIVLCFCACGKKDKTNKNTPAPEPTGPSIEEIIEEKKKSLLKFDKTWASKDYEAPIPEPPFLCVTVNNTEQHNFKLRSKNPKQVLKLGTQSILDYCEKLKKAGYCINVNEGYNIPENPDSGYFFTAENYDGAQCMLSLEKGVVDITIMLP